ncbi:MAG: aminotransferase class V-fold PLP-dependent enzyme, partial [Chitinophagales bacterium]
MQNLPAWSINYPSRLINSVISNTIHRFMRLFNPKSPVVGAAVGNSRQQAFALENYFESFRSKVIGHHHSFTTPYGQKKLIYADWVASGRLYRPIEEKLLHEFAPFIGNTHTETNVTGTSMTLAYHEAQQIIKRHVNACEDDVLLMVGSGMTGAVNKFQRLLGLKYPQKYDHPEERPIVFVTLLEHHSNDVSWRETSAEVVAINMDANGNVDLEHLKELLEIHKKRLFKIAAISACSNVTGVETPYHNIAKIMHEQGGLCFVDFACSAPYAAMDMHPEEEGTHLDAIYFSMHKFLGGPGTPGVLVFHRSLYSNSVPDHPGGGTVTWVNRWGEQAYIPPTHTHGIEAREDGGTPAFLQTIKAGLCVQLKEQMGVENILAREKQLLPIAFHELRKAKGLHILAD